MDQGSWSRAYSYARRCQLRSDACRGDEYEGGEEHHPEFLCPFCADEFDMLGLFCHIDEEHPAESANGVCPVCARKVGSDLVHHMTAQHGSILKIQRRRRARRAGSSSFLFSSSRKELKEGKMKIQSFLGGSSFSVPSSREEPDPLLTSFVCTPPVADECPNIQPLSSLIKASSTAESNIDNLNSRDVLQPIMSDEDQKEKAQKCEFVQGLLLSTIFYDNLWDM